MKKAIIILLFLTCTITKVKALEVKLDKCVDGDTARFIIDGKSTSFRFLAIDTPEVDTTAGKDASKYTCNKLKKAKKITIEYDPNSDKTDKYDRHLAWIFVDDYLLQKDLVENGYARVAYLYGDYKYTHLLEEKKEEETNTTPLLFAGLAMTLIIIYIQRKQIFI